MSLDGYSVAFAIALMFPSDLSTHHSRWHATQMYSPSNAQGYPSSTYLTTLILSHPSYFLHTTLPNLNPTNPHLHLPICPILLHNIPMSNHTYPSVVGKIFNIPLYLASSQPSRWLAMCA
jgi:hypothetical protein